MFRNNDNNRLAAKGRTSVCRSGVMNLGANPRVLGVMEGGGVVAREMPTRRKERNYLPSHQMVLETLLRCVPICLPHGEGRAAVQSRFYDAMRDGNDVAFGDPRLCKTPLRWICEALHPNYHVSLVRSLDDIMEQGQRMMTGMGDFFLMDVILNRKLEQSAAVDGPYNPDDVVMASAKWDSANLEPQSDFMYRTFVAYLPGAGVFYCARERRPAAVGLVNTPVHHDVSWLRIMEDTDDPPMFKRFSFGTDGFVRRFSKVAFGGLPTSHRVSAWRVSYGTERVPSLLVFRAMQCLDADGPRMPPDIVANIDIGAWPVADRGVQYNSMLAMSKAAKVGGRHYAKGCLHLRIPEDCLVIDGGEDCPHVDIVVDIAPRGSFKTRKSVVRVRNLVSPSMYPTFVGMSGEPLLMDELRTIVCHNSILRKRVAVGHARSSQGDVGAMHPIGTRVLPDGLTTVSYSATNKVSRELLEAYVRALSRIGQTLFPDVLAVIQDTEGDTGLKPCTEMAGDAVGNRVGFSIDTSVDLANSSHFDVNDASQGYSVWTEDVPGMATNWYFVMPNVHGMLSDESTGFNGVAIKLRHGTAISWDGRLIRHCTSLSRPDGPEARIGSGHGCRQTNHLYGTFTAAKERIVNAGRRKAAMR